MISCSITRRSAFALLSGAAWLPTIAAGDQVVRLSDGRVFSPEIAKIVIRGKLVVAILDKDTPPFVYTSGEQVLGVDIELVQQVATELRVPIEYDRSATTYNAVAQRVAEGYADLGVSKLARTLKRAQSVLFSVPYMHLQHALLVNRLAFAKLSKGQSVSQTVRHFSGSIGVIAGSSWEEFSRRNFGNATTIRFGTWGQAVDAVKGGKVVAIYRDAIEVRSVMRTDPKLALTLQTVTFSDLNSLLCVVVGFNSPSLKSFIDEIISQRTEKLTVDSLLSRRKI